MDIGQESRVSICCYIHVLAAELTDQWHRKNILVMFMITTSERCNSIQSDTANATYHFSLDRAFYDLMQLHKYISPDWQDRLTFHISRLLFGRNQTLMNRRFGLHLLHRHNYIELMTHNKPEISIPPGPYIALVSAFRTKLFSLH